MWYLYDRIAHRLISGPFETYDEALKAIRWLPHDALRVGIITSRISKKVDVS